MRVLYLTRTATTAWVKYTKGLGFICHLKEIVTVFTVNALSISPISVVSLLRLMQQKYFVRFRQQNTWLGLWNHRSFYSVNHVLQMITSPMCICFCSIFGVAKLWQYKNVTGQWSVAMTALEQHLSWHCRKNTSTAYGYNQLVFNTNSYYIDIWEISHT